MKTIESIISIEKFILLTIFTSITYVIITNYKNKSLKEILKIIATNLSVLTIYFLLKRYIQQIYLLPVLFVAWVWIIKIISNKPWNYSVFVFAIALVVSYISYLLSVLLSGITLKLLIPTIDYKNPISMIVIPIMMVIINGLIYNLKRIKNGINFLKNVEKVDNIGKFTNAIILLTILIAEAKKDDTNILLNTFVAIIGLAITYFIINWIQSQITKHYKNDMKSHTIEVQKEEIEEHLKTIEEVKAENLKLATAVHKYNHRISALEKALRDTAKNANNTEFAEEISVFLKETEDISKGFAKESEVITKTLPLTHIAGIDNMFKFMQEEAINSGINFDLKINTSIHDLIDKIIPKDKFETLLGDHLKDAIIAINSSDKTYKSILVILGIVDDCYELSIYDTGIEFEIETLLKLGKERITTHNDIGGSGIGFMTTFETLESTKASLIIEEYNPETTSYTKSVNIRFDEKNNYKIYSYRAEEIRNKNKDKKIIIKNIE